MIARNVQKKFIEKFGEKGYTSSQICRSLHECEGKLDLRMISEKRIREYAKTHNLAIDLKLTEIMTPTVFNPTRYLIKESDLELLIEGMGLAVSVDDFKEILDEHYYNNLK